MAPQGVWAQKLNFIFILQFYQHFWLYRGSGLLSWNFISILQFYQHFWLYKGFNSTILPTFLALQGVWASKFEFMFIPQIYQHFWLYKGSGIQSLNLCPFHKSTNIFGSTRGLGSVIEFYFHSTNLPTFLALQGV